MYIVSSVGRQGNNRRSDVRFIQGLISALARRDMRLSSLLPDGVCGPNTISGIGKFQTLYVGLSRPDYRIDPGGRSEQTLLTRVDRVDPNIVARTARECSLGRIASLQVVNPTINYRSGVSRCLSRRTEDVVKKIMTQAGVSRCDISSTIRSFQDQARAMYHNCERFPNVNSVSELRAARKWGYAAPGRAVEEVYFNLKGGSSESVISSMRAKIEQLYSQGKKVSKHCVSQADFERVNILDIPHSGVVASHRVAFEIAIMALSGEVQNARHSSPVKGQTLVSKLIVEDKCWHIEVPQIGGTIS